MAADRITPSAEQLAAAWAARRRATWPSTMAETMCNPVLAGIVRSEALRRILASRKAKAHPLQPGQPAPPPLASAPAAPARTARPPAARHSAPPAPATHPAAHPAVDLKRRAAGDTD